MMTILEAKHFIREFESIFTHYQIHKSKAWLQQREQYRIIKAMHAVEKGLSLKNIKLGFGVPKILALMKRIENYYNR